MIYVLFTDIFIIKRRLCIISLNPYYQANYSVAVMLQYDFADTRCDSFDSNYVMHAYDC